MNRMIGAIVREQGQFKAALLEESGRHLVLRDCGAWSDQDADWETAAGRLGQAGGDRFSDGPVVGFDSRQVAFYQLQVPAVRESELSAMVELQTEGVLPLPPEQMVTAWQAHPSQNGKMIVTLAAARQQQVKGFSRDVRPIRPQQVLLDSEAVVKLWQALCPEAPDDAIVLRLCEDTIQCCLVLQKRFHQAAYLDQGTSDLFDRQGLKAGAVETLVLDLRAVLEQFGVEAGAVAVYVLDDGTQRSELLAGHLQSMQFQSSFVPLESAETLDLSARGRALIGNCLPAIALALAATGAEKDSLQLFRKVDVTPQVRKQTTWRPTWAGLSVVVVLLAMTAMLVAVRADERRLVYYQQYLTSNEQILELIQDRRVRQVVQRQRFNPLEILEKVNLNDMKEIHLTGMQYKRGQSVRLSGYAKDKNMIYDYVAALQEVEGVSDLLLDDVSKNEQKKSQQFTLTFHYEDWTRRSLK